MSTAQLSTPQPPIEENLEPRAFTTNAGCIPQLPVQRERVARMKGACFTMLVVGESGLGKSTFIRTLLGSDFTTQRHRVGAEAWRSPVNAAGPSSARFPGSLSETASASASSSNVPVASTSAASAFGVAPASGAAPVSDVAPVSSTGAAARQGTMPSDVHSTAEIEIHHAVVTENKFDTDLTVIDTPGFGDYTDNTNTWVPVANYIDAQHQYYMCQEEQPDRSQLRDSRVHVCLYFLAPTGRVLELDLVAMRELGRRVNLVPVIAKGDSMTPEDLAAFKQYIQLALSEHGVQVWAPPSEVGSEWTQSWPFAVVASDEFVELPSGERTRGRKYHWGLVDIYNPQHSDFALLRDLLIGRHFLDLVDATSEVHYARQRRNLRLMRLRRALNLDGRSAARNSAADEPSRRGPNKLLPSERASLAFMGPSLRSLALTDEPSLDSDVAAEALQSMGAIDLLLAISKVGQHFLNSERHENDALLRQRTLALQAQFDVVIKFQEERFEAQAADLEKTRDQLSQEIAGLSDYNQQLVSEIRDLEFGRR